MSMKQSKYRKQNLIFLAVLCCILLVQIYKAHIGVGVEDEHFYLTLGWRLYQGDALFYDDWHIAQMISVFNYPIIAVYRLFHGNNNGIYLFARYVYILYTSLIGTGIYLKFRDKGTASIAASAVYMLFCPLSMMAMGYNVMNIGFVTLALLVWPTEKFSKWRSFLAGIFMACAVLNTPYLIFLYVLLTVLTFWKPRYMNRRIWKWMTAGALMIALCFLLLVFSRASFSQVTASIPHFIDPSHTGAFYLFAKNGAKLLLAFHVFAIAFIVEIAYAYRLKDQAEERKQKLLKISIWINALSMIWVCFSPWCYEHELSTWMECLFPFTVIGIELLIMYQEDAYILSCFYASLFLAVMICFQTNVGPRTYCSPLILACSMTVLMMKEHMGHNRWFLPFFLAILLFFRITDTFYGSGGDNPLNYTVRVTDGPLAGLYDTQETVETENERLADMRELDAMPEMHYMLITSNAWQYLAVEHKRLSSISTFLYLWEEDEFTTAQDEYAEIHSYNNPVYIYLGTPYPYHMNEKDPWLQKFEKIENMRQGILYLRK